MPTGLVTNVQSMNAQRLININQSNLARTTEKLSSGLRINRAADDPSGLGISQVLTSQIRGDNAGLGNIQQGASAIQVADAALSQVTDVLQRMRELAVSAANESLSSSQTAALQSEYQSLITAIDDIVSGSTFNGKALLDGSVTAAVSLQIGAQTTQQTTLSFATNFKASQTTGLGLGGFSLTTFGGATAAIASVANAITTVSTGRSNFGAKSQALDALRGALDNTIIANTDARSRLTDADMATEISGLVRQQLPQQSGASALAAANFSTQFILRLLQ